MTYKKIYMTFNIKRHMHARVIFRWHPSKSTLAHDAVATAVLHKHHPIMRVGAGLIQFVYRSHLRLTTEATRNRNTFSPFFPRVWCTSILSLVISSSAAIVPLLCRKSVKCQHPWQKATSSRLLCSAVSRQHHDGGGDGGGGGTSVGVSDVKTHSFLNPHSLYVAVGLYPCDL